MFSGVSDCALDVPQQLASYVFVLFDLLTNISLSPINTHNTEIVPLYEGKTNFEKCLLRFNDK